MKVVASLLLLTFISLLFVPEASACRGRRSRRSNGGSSDNSSFGGGASGGGGDLEGGLGIAGPESSGGALRGESTDQQILDKLEEISRKLDELGKQNLGNPAASLQAAPDIVVEPYQPIDVERMVKAIKARRGGQPLLASSPK